ncbi:MAG: DUF1223 domain-containing protein [Acidiferrobacterales bacterium]
MKWVAFLATMVIGFNAHASPLEFNSGDTQTVMVELYTSEGCSSCPPAEKFLNQFAQNNQLWKRYIPLALHVGYWDYLGWRDRFARPEHAQRQRAYASLHHSPTIYTPAFFVNGDSWRTGFFQHLPNPESPKVGNLGIRVTGNKVDARFTDSERDSKRLRVHVAVAGLGLKTRIKAGENAGRSARHDFVLLGETELEPVGPGHWEGQLPPTPGFHPERFALVAWVAGPGSPAPIQATGGYLPNL